MTQTETTITDPYAGWQTENATMESDGRPDTLIVPLVEALRAKGVVTHRSCQGHPRDECRQKACAFPYDELCYHPGQLAVDAKTLDPVSALRVESPLFTQIMCLTWPSFVWLFQWHAKDRRQAIDCLLDLEPMKGES